MRTAPDVATVADHVWPKWHCAEVSHVDVPLVHRVRDELAVGGFDTAVQFLVGRLSADEDPWTRILLGDAFASQGDWRRAGLEYQRAAALDPANQVAQLGLAHSLASVGRVPESLDVLGRVALTCPDADSATVAFYRALALLHRAAEIRGVTRDGESIITGRVQAQECARIADEVLSLTSDAALTEVARRLRQEAEAASGYTWSRRPALWVATLLVIAVALAGVLIGGLRSSTPILAAGILLGAGAVVTCVTVGRRPVWREQADRVAPVLARSGI